MNPPTPRKVIDLTLVRAERSQENRRTVERYFLHHMIDAVVETAPGQETTLEIVEVSETGCSFRLSEEKAKTLPVTPTGVYLPIRARLYFSRDSYLLVGLDVINFTTDIAGGRPSVRFGCKLDPSFASTDAYVQFVRFIQAFSEGCSRDTKHASSI